MQHVKVSCASSSVSYQCPLLQELIVFYHIFIKLKDVASATAFRVNKTKEI